MKILSQKFWEELCDDWPDTELFNHHLDNQFKTPARRANIYWEEKTPEYFFGCDTNIKLYRGARYCKPISNNISLLPESWQRFLSFIKSDKYKKNITNDNIFLYLNIIEDFADNFVHEINEDHKNNVKNNITITRPKYYDEHRKFEFFSPPMKLHTDSANKYFTHLFYFNREWDINYGGRLIKFYKHDPKAIRDFFNIFGNVNNHFEVTENSWHSTEGFSVPDPKITRKRVQISIFKS